MSQTPPIPTGPEAESRWRRLPWSRRLALGLGGATPADDAEAATSLGHARRLSERNGLWSVVGALSGFVVALFLAIVTDGTVTTESLIIAGGIGVGVGLGFETARRVQSRRLEGRARQVLDTGSG